ncbi:cytochrome c3 family protein [Pollutimonas thiosulfatoxidans]
MTKTGDCLSCHSPHTSIYLVMTKCAT